MTMNESLKVPASLRAATSDDIPGILEMIRELAEFENLSDQVVATEADYQESLFGKTPVAGAIVAESEGNLVGYAIYFSTFSSFIGRAGLWLEDLYVRPAFRGTGVGKGLLKAVGQIAADRDAGRYEWSVLDWNQNAIDLYERVGGEILQEWRIVRMDRDGIENLTSQ
jgi:GNAT superfamily N-acetyltransferase